MEERFFFKKKFSIIIFENMISKLINYIKINGNMFNYGSLEKFNISTCVNS